MVRAMVVAVAMTMLAACEPGTLVPDAGGGGGGTGTGEGGTGGRFVSAARAGS